MSLRVYYRSEMVAEANPKRFSPSAAKPRQVYQDWVASGLDLDVKKPWPASALDLERAHAPEYVEGILTGRIANGFGDTGEDVRKALPFTVGAMVCAAKHAIKTGENAAALCSGFHHAYYDHGGGFCTFAGLIVAAQSIKQDAKRVGILDLDYHYGNGTDSIIKKLKLDWISHFTAGATFHHPDQAEAFLKALPAMIKRKFWDCNVLIYQAGADPHVADPLGGFLTTEQLRERDRIVFTTAAQMRLPVAWNLAGGYQRDKDGGIGPVLEIHRNTAIECIAASKKKKMKAS